MLEYQLELENRERIALELAEDLDRINNEIARLRLQKEEKEKELIAALGHEKEGSTTYTIGHRSVTVKTDYIYALDKRAYIGGECFIPEEFDPVLQKITYEVNKKLYHHYEQSAPAEVRQRLYRLITRKASKPSVKIEVKA